MMKATEFLFLYITPYLALAVFVGGIASQVYCWRNRKMVPGHLSLYPRPNGQIARIGHVLLDMLTLRSLWRVNKPVWVLAFVMHASLLLLLLGHVRTVVEYSIVWNVLGWGDDRVQFVTHTSGVAVGLLFMITLFGLLARRLSGTAKLLSTPEDYLLLFLLLSITVTGHHMRMFHVDFTELRAYTTGLLTLNWQPSPTTAGMSFLLHFLLVQMLLVYFPFTKLNHTIGAFFAKMVAQS